MMKKLTIAATILSVLIVSGCVEKNDSTNPTDHERLIVALMEKARWHENYEEIVRIKNKRIDELEEERNLSIKQVKRDLEVFKRVVEFLLKFKPNYKDPVFDSLSEDDKASFYRIGKLDLLPDPNFPDVKLETPTSAEAPKSGSGFVFSNTDVNSKWDIKRNYCCGDGDVYRRSAAK